MGRKIGIRVGVLSGDRSNDLGEGTYLGEVTIYAWYDGDKLCSCKDAEQIPDLKEIPPGAELLTLRDNPKIKLDDGRIVYGCQVWWAPLEEESNADRS